MVQRFYPKIIKIIDFLTMLLRIPDWPVTKAYEIICAISTVVKCVRMDQKIDEDQITRHDFHLSNVQKCMEIIIPIHVSITYIFNMLLALYIVGHKSKHIICGAKNNIALYFEKNHHLVLTVAPVHLKEVIDRELDLSQVLECIISEDPREENNRMAVNEILEVMNQAKSVIFLSCSIVRIGRFKIVVRDVDQKDRFWSKDFLLDLAANTVVIPSEEFYMIFTIRALSIMILLALLSLFGLVTNTWALVTIYFFYITSVVILQTIRWKISKKLLRMINKSII